MPQFSRPTSLDDALSALRDSPWLVLAGATDVYPAAANRTAWGEPGLMHPAAAPVMDISGLPELQGIYQVDGAHEIGALVTWTELIQAQLPPWFDCLRLAAKEVGGHQIQNRGTIAGNLCNASPAADGVPALLALDARLRLRSRSAQREVPLTGFITGNRRTALQPDELVTTIIVPHPPPASRSAFLKLGARRYLVISIAMAALCVQVQEGLIEDIRIAVGACSEVAVRLRALEAWLRGSEAGAAAGLVGPDDFTELRAIDDVRASAAYRVEAAQQLVRRLLTSPVMR
ncbi:MAG: xanthine dehydrogenase family protein subunit M [Gammaproteobacteria bacterium]|nr:xanthine dehydrogenase family protein subunit M [Gammaproteobacteria bacterium]